MSNSRFAFLAALHLGCAALAVLALHFFATTRGIDSSYWSMPALLVAGVSIVGMLTKAHPVVRLSFALWFVACVVFQAWYLLMLSTALH